MQRCKIKSPVHQGPEKQARSPRQLNGLRLRRACWFKPWSPSFLFSARWPIRSPRPAGTILVRLRCPASAAGYRDNAPAYGVATPARSNAADVPLALSAIRDVRVIPSSRAKHCRRLAQHTVVVEQSTRLAIWFYPVQSAHSLVSRAMFVADNPAAAAWSPSGRVQIALRLCWLPLRHRAERG